MTMIERVARAICKSQTQTDRTWEAFLPEATAAIEAMREPTDAMVDAGSSHFHEENSTGAAAYCFGDMIDAALNEQVSG